MRCGCLQGPLCTTPWHTAARHGTSRRVAARGGAWRRLAAPRGAWRRLAAPRGASRRLAAPAARLHYIVHYIVHSPRTRGTCGASRRLAAPRGVSRRVKASAGVVNNGASRDSLFLTQRCAYAHGCASYAPTVTHRLGPKSRARRRYASASAL